MAGLADLANDDATVLLLYFDDTQVRDCEIALEAPVCEFVRYSSSLSSCRPQG